MKNPSKTSRRSFLKQSSLGVLAAANTSLFSGLLTGDAKAAIPWCYFAFTRTVDNYPDNSYPTQEEATTAAIAAISNPAYQSFEFFRKDLAYGRNCVPRTPATTEGEVTPHIVQADDGNWSYTLSGSVTFTVCD